MTDDCGPALLWPAEQDMTPLDKEMLAASNAALISRMADTDGQRTHHLRKMRVAVERATLLYLQQRGVKLWPVKPT